MEAKELVTRVSSKLLGLYYYFSSTVYSNIILVFFLFIID